MFPVTSPVLLVDQKKCERNIARMAQRATRAGARFRPHMKTHQSADIGEWLRNVGVTGITVSSVTMAEYFAHFGWDDITIAFPCNILEAERLDRLAKKIDLGILVSDPFVVHELGRRLTNPVRTYIEIDTGAGRTGIPGERTGALEAILRETDTAPLLKLKGFYSHPGHSYSARSRQEVQEIHLEAYGTLTELRSRFEDRYGPLKICLGDTPCCSIGESFEGIDEMSPGNFIFYDLMQQQIGACEAQDIATVLACPVVSRHESRNEVTVHGGAVHLSKERLTENGMTHYGRVVRLDEHGWGEQLDGCHVDRLSQEHGTVTLTPEEFGKVSIGDLLGIVPVHSCLTADLMGGYRTTEGTALNHLRKEGTISG